MEGRDDINVIVSTYDMAVKPTDNKFFRRLEADVSTSIDDTYSKWLTSSRFLFVMKVIF